MAWYGLFVLKVLLNPNQPTNHLAVILSSGHTNNTSKLQNCNDRILFERQKTVYERMIIASSNDCINAAHCTGISR